MVSKFKHLHKNDAIISVCNVTFLPICQFNGNIDTFRHFSLCIRFAVKHLESTVNMFIFKVINISSHSLLVFFFYYYYLLRV